MDTKLLTGAGCLLLLVAAMTPVALGHDERPNDPLPGNYPGAGSGAGVSGKYVGAAGPATADETDYPGTIAAGQILCDLEVLGNGQAPDPLDETLVDGASGGNQANTWDDGGFGGACHTDSYGYAPYNTPGCDGTARADNGLAISYTFIGATCDWKTTFGGTPSSEIFTACVVNALIRGGSVGEFVVCTLDFVACATSSDPRQCAWGGFEWCGADHVADGINYGHGSGPGSGVPFPSSGFGPHQGDVAVEYDSDGDGIMDAQCYEEDATAVVFVFDAVNTVGSLYSSQLYIHPAGTGEIWTT